MNFVRRVECLGNGLTHDLIRNLSTLGNDVQIETGEHESVIPVQTTFTDRRILLLLPLAETAEVPVYVVWSLQPCRFRVQNLQPLQYETHFVPEGCIMI